MQGFTPVQGTGQSGGGKPPSAVDILQGVASILTALAPGSSGGGTQPDGPADVPQGIQLAGVPGVGEQSEPPTIGSDADPPRPSDYIKPGQGTKPDQGVEITDGGATFAAGVAASLLAALIYEGGKAAWDHYHPTKEQLQDDITALQSMIPKTEQQIKVLEAAQREVQGIMDRAGLADSVELREIKARLEAAKGNLSQYKGDLDQKKQAIEQLKHPDPPPQW